MDKQKRVEVDPELFRRFRDGDDEAACHVVERFHRPVLAFLRNLLADHDLAEDVAQEVFLQLLEHRANLRGVGQLASWIFTVAVRTARRQEQRGTVLRGNKMIPIKSEFPPDQGLRLQQEGRSRIVLHALSSLPDTERELLTLRYFAGLSIRELSKAMDMPMGSVGVKISRSLDRLRRELAASGHKLEDLL